MLRRRYSRRRFATKSRRFATVGAGNLAHCVQLLLRGAGFTPGGGGRSKQDMKEKENRMQRKLLGVAVAAALAAPTLALAQSSVQVYGTVHMSANQVKFSN